MNRTPSCLDQCNRRALRKLNILLEPNSYNSCTPLQISCNPGPPSQPIAQNQTQNNYNCTSQFLGPAEVDWVGRAGTFRGLPRAIAWIAQRCIAENPLVKVPALSVHSGWSYQGLSVQIMQEKWSRVPAPDSGSSVVIDRLNHARGESKLSPVKPLEVFDLIGATSTGG